MIHKLDLDEFDEIDYCLIALHTSYEDYRLAYFINKSLGISLTKCRSGIQLNIKNSETSFSRFTFQDVEKNITWNLVQNKSEFLEIKKETTRNLFSAFKNEVATKAFLLPEIKKTDYFLKIEHDQSVLEVAILISNLNTIPGITIVYEVDPKKIKSKNNLIF